MMAEQDITVDVLAEDYDKAIELAGKMRISDVQLQDWAEAKAKEFAQGRVKNQMRKEEKERTERKEEQERIERKEEKDREERVLKMQYDRDVELEKIKLAAEGKPITKGSDTVHMASRPKLPMFSEKFDCIDDYLTRFECFAVIFEI